MTINQQSSTIQIKAWQSFLLQQGYNIVGSADGRWGPNTESATKQFQTSQGLSADGNPGVDTIAAASRLGFVLPSVSDFPPIGLIDVVIDLSHHNDSVDLARAKAAGILAVFHKTTQSIGPSLFIDKEYAIRQAAAKAEGLLWGAYHFGSGGSGKEQAQTFLQHANPDGNTLLALDFEPDTTQGETTMTVDEAAEFISEVYNQTGKYPGLYGGSLLRESTVFNSPSFSVLSNCWLWLAQYGTDVHLPPKWTDYILWQYTDGSAGPSALPVDGIGKCDREVFKGTEDDLANFWKKNAV